MFFCTASFLFFLLFCSVPSLHRLGIRAGPSDCVEQMKRMFKPDQEAIKKRIEDLITHEFLERDNENPNLLWYLP
ncbi:hypothetical protein L2E82_48697 [Cichorium intybus]|uniref:Uncharacterized protein n=1 Tax=Cichorium intybus TaxID=13427 RepID=A0ACB8Z2T9_CICIN|nr:hypothetical protein L2E82_48697 [Cichorium intybus]